MLPIEAKKLLKINYCNRHSTLIVYVKPGYYTVYVSYRPVWRRRLVCE